MATDKTRRFTVPQPFILDTELGILHKEKCGDKALGFAFKYRYAMIPYPENLQEVEELERQYKTCQRCLERMKPRKSRATKPSNRPV